MNINIDVISDVVCPWCFIGKRRLEKALESFDGEHQIGMVWRPFELNPELPRDGMDRKSYLDAKFGGPERAREIYSRITAAGAAEGIGFNYDAIRRTPNTFDAHRLLWMAQRGAIQNALAELLFNDYFANGRDLGDHAVLTAAAGQCGIDTAEAGSFLEGPGGAEEVRREQWVAHEIGVSAVPYFIINGRYGFSGAQDPQMILSVLKRVVEEDESPRNVFEPAT